MKVTIATDKALHSSSFQERELSLPLPVFYHQNRHKAALVGFYWLPYSSTSSAYAHHISLHDRIFSGKQKENRRNKGLKKMKFN